MQRYRLEVNTEPQVTGTGKLDQDFPWFFLGPRANAELVPETHVVLYASRTALLSINTKILAKTQPSQHDQHSVIILPSKHKTQPKRSNSFPAPHTPSSPFPACYLLQSQRLALFPAYLCQRDERTPPENIQSSKMLFPPQ
jgi:hypothetical protein